jgi:ribosomal-protein-alanine N-acetyltransferase
MAIERIAFDQPWSAQSFARELSLPFSKTIVCVVNDSTREAVVGYLCRWLVADECHILNIAVDPRFRRHGVGEILMSEVIAEAIAKGATLISLEVRRSNLPARHLYRKCGFEDRRIRRRYYEGREDAIVMERRIDRH